MRSNLAERPLQALQPQSPNNAALPMNVCFEDVALRRCQVRWVSTIGRQSK